MKLKCALLFLSVFSTSVYANTTHNLNTVVNNGNIDKIVTELVNSFKVGQVDKTFPIKVEGSYELDNNNRLISINVKENAFKLINIPIVGTYQTKYSISANIPNGNCTEAKVSNYNIIEGIPSYLNPAFAARLNQQGDSAVKILIKNSGLNAYCEHKPTYLLEIY